MKTSMLVFLLITTCDSTVGDWYFSTNQERCGETELVQQKKKDIIFYIYIYLQVESESHPPLSLHVTYLTAKSQLTDLCHLCLPFMAAAASTLCQCTESVEYISAGHWAHIPLYWTCVSGAIMSHLHRPELKVDFYKEAFYSHWIPDEQLDVGQPQWVHRHCWIRMIKSKFWVIWV